MKKLAQSAALAATLIVASAGATVLYADNSDTSGSMMGRGGMMGGARGGMMGRMSQMMSHCGGMMSGGSDSGRPNEQWRRGAPDKDD